MGAMISMSLDDEEKGSVIQPMPMPDKPDYPYGLAISLTSNELDKLGIDVTEATVGGVFHIEGLARITSLSMNEGPDGMCCRLEAQIEDLAVLGGDEAAPAPKRLSSLYTSKMT